MQRQADRLHALSSEAHRLDAGAGNQFAALSSVRPPIWMDGVEVRLAVEEQRFEVEQLGSAAAKYYGRPKTRVAGACVGEGEATGTDCTAVGTSCAGEAADTACADAGIARICDDGSA